MAHLRPRWSTAASSPPSRWKSSASSAWPLCALTRSSAATPSSASSPTSTRYRAVTVTGVPSVPSEIKDPALAEKGALRIEWAWRRCPCWPWCGSAFRRERPLDGVRLSACLHITSETANLLTTLKDGGAGGGGLRLQPLSTQDDVAALVQQHEIPVYAVKGEDDETTTATSAPPSTTGPRSPWTTQGTSSRRSTRTATSSSRRSSGAPKRRPPA